MELVRASAWMRPGLPLPGAHNKSMVLPVARLFVHHSAGPVPINRDSEVELLRQYDAQHRAKGWDGLGYSFAIGPSGTVYEGRGTRVGAHTEANNSTAFGVCLLGNFQDALPTPAAMISLASLIGLMRLPHPGYGLPDGALTPNSETLGHRDAIVNGKPYPTACPGNKLYANLPNLRALIGDPMHDPAPDQPKPSYKVNAAPVGIAVTPTGGGYLIVCADGGVITFGDAVYLGGVHL